MPAAPDQPTNGAPPPEPGPAIVVTFHGAGAADFTVAAPGVSMAQLLAAAAYLTVAAELTAAGFIQRQAAQSILPAGQADLAAVMAAVRRAS